VSNPQAPSVPNTPSLTGIPAHPSSKSECDKIIDPTFTITPPAIGLQARAGSGDAGRYCDRRAEGVRIDGGDDARKDRYLTNPEPKHLTFPAHQS
jgi:hypothetical protein